MATGSAIASPNTAQKLTSKQQMCLGAPATLDNLKEGMSLQETFAVIISWLMEVDICRKYWVDASITNQL